MLSVAVVVAAAVLWLGLLFGTALYAERRPGVLASHWHHVYALSLQGTNLADEEYRTTGYNLVSAGLGVLTGFYGAPRQYSLTARYNF